jgi:hypothetical protein
MLRAVARFFTRTGLSIDNRTARWGTGDLGVSDVNTSTSLREEPEPWRVAALARATSTVRNVKGGIRTRSFQGAKYPTSSPPASVEPRDARQTE